MKLTKKQLRQIIKEELKAVIEAYGLKPQGLAAQNAHHRRAAGMSAGDIGKISSLPHRDARNLAQALGSEEPDHLDLPKMPTGEYTRMSKEELETIMRCTKHQKQYLWAQHYLKIRFGIDGPSPTQGTAEDCPPIIKPREE